MFRASFPHTVCCINLSRRVDRRLAAWNVFHLANLTVQRISAPNASSAHGARGWRNIGARACALGHRLAWRAAAREKGDSVLVLEDDVILAPIFKHRFTELRFPVDWDIIYLGCIFRTLPRVFDQGVVRVTGPTWGTHAMILRSGILPRLHSLLAGYSGRSCLPVKKPMAIDNLLSTLHGELNVYASYPNLAWQRPGISDIDGCRKGAWDSQGQQTAFPEVIAELDKEMAKFTPATNHQTTRPENLTTILNYTDLRFD